MKSLVLKIFALALVTAAILMAAVGCAGRMPTLNGVDIEQYKIVYDADAPDYNLRAAEHIQERIEKVSKIKLPIVEDGEEQSEHEIVVGETNREISALLDEKTEGVEFSILAHGGSVALEGDYFVIAAAAYYFTETYAGERGFRAAVPETAEVHTPIVKEAKNFILLIGDGMGVNQTKLFEKYDVASEGDLAYSDGEDIFYGYMLPSSAEVTTSSLDGITDSAAAGTALSSGYKTHNRYIGKNGDGENVQSLTELAGSLGMATAVMSTEAQNGATPSTFYGHASDRGNTTELTQSRIETTQKYGTVISCNFNFYTAKKLTEIEKKITDTLGKVSEDKDGFFMMYEEAYIDKHASNGDMDMTFNALVRFNQAIGRFMEYAFYNPETLVLITADHETGGLTVDGDDWHFTTEEHTAANVKLFSWGDGSELFNGKTVDNTQIAKTLAKMLGNSSFGDPNGLPAIEN